MSYQDLTNQVQNLVETNSALVTEVSRVRDSAMGLLRLYPTITAGREASAIGQYFSVPGNGAFVRLYQKTSASQQDLIAEYPTIDVFEGALAQAQQDADRSTTEADRSTTEANRSRDEADRAYQEYLNAQNVVVTNGTTLFDLDVATSVQPTLSSNFSRNKHERYEVYGNEPKTILQQWDVDRNSTATYIDANGVLQTAAVNQPRIDYSSGEGRLLVEGQSTNLFTDSGFQASIIGAALPSNWSIENLRGLSSEVVNVGSFKGIGFVDVRFFGTSIGSGNITLRRGFGFSTPAGESKTFSAYLGYISGNNAPDFVALSGIETGVWSGTSSDALLKSTWKRLIATRVSTTGNSIQPRIICGTLSGVNYDFIIRIGGSQFEEGTKATSYIPTQASQVTRLADIITPKGDE